MKKLKKKYHFIGSEIIQRTPENCEIKNYIFTLIGEEMSI